MPYQQWTVPTPTAVGNEGFRDLVSSLLAGYKAGAYPAEQKQKYRGEEENILKTALANKLTEQYGAKEKEADIGYKNALATHANDPLSRLTGIPAEVYGLKTLQDQLGEDHPIVQQVKKGFENRIAQQQSLMSHRQNIMQTRNFSSLPAAEKQRTLSIIAGAGITPTDGLKMLNAGASLEDILQTQGRTIEDVTPNYPLGAAAVNQLQQREGFSEEIKTLENRLSDAIPEGRTVLGYSIPETLSAIKNDDPDKIGKTLAWRAMQPELASLRLKAMGGNVGIEAIREMKEAALGNLHVVESSISREAKQAMNKYISQWVEEAANTYNKTLLKGSSLGKKANQVAKIIKDNSASNNDPLGMR